jgi:hypothetical protein
MEPTERMSWSRAAESWRRMGERADAAHGLWLESLSVEESIRILEDLTEGIPELDREDIPDDPPVVLFRIWVP